MTEEAPISEGLPDGQPTTIEGTNGAEGLREHPLDAPAEATPEAAAQPVYFATITPTPAPGERPIHPEFARAILDLEATLGMQLWVLMQTGSDHLGKSGPYDLLTNSIANAFFQQRGEMPTDQPVALLIHSPGGQADAAYRLASLFRQNCGGFVAIVPRYAKSAATLLALGAETIIMGDHAELGPLDAQIANLEREEWISALDEVQALERLHAFAMDAFDRTVLMMQERSHLKTREIVPMTLHFVSEFMQPLLAKIDTVHYTQMSRVLKVAEEYAFRLLQPKHSRDNARNIASRLVEQYPEHGFVIDVAEATRALKLHVIKATPEQEAVIERLLPFLHVPLSTRSIVGRIKEIPNVIPPNQ